MTRSGPSALERRWSMSLAARYFCSLTFLAWASRWWGADALVADRLVGMLLAFFASVASWIVPRSGEAGRWGRLLLAACLVAVHCWSVVRSDPFIVWPTTPTLVAGLFLLGIPLVGAASLFRILPLKMTFFASVLFLGGVVALVVRPETFAVVPINTPVLHSTWAGGRFGDQKCSSGHARSILALYYPDDPMGAFVHERTSGTLDLRTFAVHTLEGTRARRASDLEDPNFTRVEIDRCDPANPWKVSFYRYVFDLNQGDEWNLSFEVRSDARRTVELTLEDKDDGKLNLGLKSTLSLSPQWQRFEFPVSVKETRLYGRLKFEVGNSGQAIEWRNLSWKGSKLGPRYPRTRYAVYSRFNDEGYRSPDRSIAKPSGTYRIAILGDSQTFGQGVPDGSEYPRVLEKMLNDGRRAGHRVEVMNFGICGMDTHQERLVYLHRVAKYRPDLVLVAMYDNDDVPPVPTDENPPEFSTLPATWVQKLQGLPGRDGFKRCMNHLKLLKDQCDKDGVQLAVCVLNLFDDPASVELVRLLNNLESDLGVPVLDLKDRLLFPVEWSESIVHRIDGHFNASTHHLVAALLLPWLDEKGLVPGK